MSTLLDCNSETFKNTKNTKYVYYKLLSYNNVMHFLQPTQNAN